MKSTNQLDRTNPHGHTVETARPEKRKVVKLVVRDGILNLMLPDGRMANGGGEYVLQIYESGLKATQAWVEDRLDKLELAHEMHAIKLQEYVDTKKDPRTYWGSVESEFRELVRRDIKPFLSCEVIGDLDTIEFEAEKRRATMMAEVAGAGAQANASSNDGNMAMMAEMIKTMQAMQSEIQRLKSGK